jgi:plastocyanin
MQHRFGRVCALLALFPIVALAAACGGSKDEASTPLQTAFKPPQSYSLSRLEQQHFPCGQENEQCAISYLRKLTRTYGPQASLGVLNGLESSGRIDQSFDTHQLAHLVGEATAKRFGANKQAFGLCPNSFNYGCVHGFFIYVLGRSTNPTKAATTICDSGGQGPLVPTFNCWHGVGHGVMMARGNDLDASLDVCDSLGSPSAADGCWQGVFMENVNAMFRDQARPGVFSKADPLRPCTRVLTAYKQECFINQAAWLAHLANDDIGKASHFCLPAGSYVSACAQSLGLMVTNPAWQVNLYGSAEGASVERIAWNLCARFPSKLQRDCVLGGVDNLANFDQLDVSESDGFCALTGRLAKTCYREIGVNLIRRTTDAATARSRCNELSAHRPDCLAGITQGQLPAAPIKVPSGRQGQQQSVATGKPSATVHMTNHGYSPRVLEIKQGQTVEFINDSSEDYWPASDPHPIHTDYPGFDAGKTILPGQSWDFTFDRTGRYGYHNHLAPETHAFVVISPKAS